MAGADETAGVVNWGPKHLGLTAKQVGQLKKNGFVVVEGDRASIEGIYGANVYEAMPSLVTADVVLQLVHTTYDSSLRRVETNHLRTSLVRMTKTLLHAAITRYAKKPDGAALRNVEYVAVAERLLGGSIGLPAAAKPKVAAELGLITAHQESAESPIFGYPVDYTQFIPRGHYTRLAALKKYFVASMWFGLVPIALEEKVGGKVRPLPDNVRSVRYLVEDWQRSGASKDWGTIDRVVTGFVGPANDLTPKDWVAAHGDLTRLRRPAMTAKFWGTAPVAGELQFRLLAQRAIPDSVAFSKLTGRERPWPSPLDFAAVLGSGRAAAILDAAPSVYNPRGWTAYQPTREALRRSWMALPASAWKSDLYRGEFGLLRRFLEPLPKAAARFYRKPAYQDLLLTSLLGSWAELRHDSLLYGEQSVAEMGDGDEPPHVKGYVEPRLAFYRDAAEWMGSLQALLALEGYLPEDAKGTIEKAINLFRFFARISDDELTGRRPTKKEYDRLWQIESDISDVESAMLIQGTNYDRLSDDDDDMAVVADVHLSEGQAQEVGTGHADDLIAVVPIEGKLWLARGAVLSFYETRVPASARMTDHTWKEAARNGKLPPRPKWMRSYFGGKTIKRK
jgi:hypothetical protein